MPDVQYEAFAVPVVGQLKVPVAVLDVPEGTDLILNWGPVPGVPALYIVTLLDAGAGTPVHCTRVGTADVTVLAGVPAPSGFPAGDGEILQVLQNVPGVRLALLMAVPPPPAPQP